jgi:hypothetical protein
VRRGDELWSGPSAGNRKMIGEFTRGMGMLVPKEELGFGERSWR